jgi:hypothetical protein
MWLRDLLPSYVGNARIATFSYLSDWYTYRKGVKTSIRELGEQLLKTLYEDRRRIGVSFLYFVHPACVRVYIYLNTLDFLMNMPLTKLDDSSTYYLHWT